VECTDFVDRPQRGLLQFLRNVPVVRIAEGGPATGAAALRGIGNLRVTRRTTVEASLHGRVGQEL
jgi:hypothetical protein